MVRPLGRATRLPGRGIAPASLRYVNFGEQFHRRNSAPGALEIARTGFAQKTRHSGARPKAASPEPIFQRPVFMGSGLAAARRPGMTGIFLPFLCEAPGAGEGYSR